MPFSLILDKCASVFLNILILVKFAPNVLSSVGGKVFHPLDGAGTMFRLRKMHIISVMSKSSELVSENGCEFQKEIKFKCNFRIYQELCLSYHQITCVFRMTYQY